MSNLQRLQGALPPSTFQLTRSLVTRTSLKHIIVVQPLSRVTV